MGGTRRRFESVAPGAPAALTLAAGLFLFTACDDDGSRNVTTTTSSTGSTRSQPPSTQSQTTITSVSTTASSLPLETCALDEMVLDPDDHVVLFAATPNEIVIETSGEGGYFDMFIRDGNVGGSSPDGEEVLNVFPFRQRFTIEYTPPANPPPAITLSVTLYPHLPGLACDSASSRVAYAEKTFAVGEIHEVTFAVAQSVGPLGALQFDVRFLGTAGGWLVHEGAVRCSAPSSLAAFNVEGDRLRAAVVNLSGLPTPGPVATCIVAGATVPELFEITVVDASDADVVPIVPLPEVVAQIEVAD